MHIASVVDSVLPKYYRMILICYYLCFYVPCFQVNGGGKWGLCNVLNSQNYTNARTLKHKTNLVFVMY